MLECESNSSRKRSLDLSELERDLGYTEPTTSTTTTTTSTESLSIEQSIIRARFQEELFNLKEDKKDKNASSCVCKFFLCC